MQLFTVEQLERGESYLAGEKYEEILPYLEGMAADAQTYIDQTYAPDDTVQWFSFSSQFELLTYKRVESDPRDLRPAERPFDRLFADLGFCQLQLGHYEEAAESLKQAVRWNPMDCAHRLDLSWVMGKLGDYEEHLRLAYSVFARASKSSHLARAYAIFCSFFKNSQQFDTAAACAKCGLALAPDDPQLNNMATELALKNQSNPLKMTDELAESLLDAQGIPTGANVEVVLSALMLADIAGAAGDMQTTADMAQIAVDLVGQERANALAQLVADTAQDEFPEDVPAENDALRADQESLTARPVAAPAAADPDASNDAVGATTGATAGAAVDPDSPDHVGIASSEAALKTLDRAAQLARSSQSEDASGANAGKTQE